MRVIGIDPSLRGTGFAVLEQEGRTVRALEFGVIQNRPNLKQSSCLVTIRDRIAEAIIAHRPDAAAIEGVIFVQSFRTAITLGAARGAALVALAERRVPIYEYAPRRAKQAVVGRGGADKAQVQFMVRALLGLDANPPADAADAMALALTHIQTAAVPARRGKPLATL